MHAGEMNLISRRVFGSLTTASTAVCLSPRIVKSAAEWSVDLSDGWKVKQKLDSVVRIKAQTVLQASLPEMGLEMKVTKIPLGITAASAFTSEDQLLLARYFSSDDSRYGPNDVAEAMVRSLQAQADTQRSTLRALYPATDGQPPTGLKRVDPTDAVTRRYVKYAYDSNTCRSVDLDGVCEGSPVRRNHVASVTVNLETQARTLAEKQMMDSGDMERRQIDVLWLCTLSAPTAKWGQASSIATRTLDSFVVQSM
uniref:Uncharacterized protein n=1 Tax=Octactis speculum TaxID=3111310 RepID=A0A7S2HEX5_9STRA|mmetsp:Transcript_64252/g.88257  ORF Transcript_64252/g.88257 Transcript_64252/m.88257 type:complete len:254 (+) Transcript_64252:1-762(+)